MLCRRARTREGQCNATGTYTRRQQYKNVVPSVLSAGLQVDDGQSPTANRSFLGIPPDAPVTSPHTKTESSKLHLRQRSVKQRR